MTGKVIIINFSIPRILAEEKLLYWVGPICSNKMSTTVVRKMEAGLKNSGLRGSHGVLGIIENPMTASSAEYGAWTRGFRAPRRHVAHSALPQNSRNLISLSPPGARGSTRPHQPFISSLLHRDLDKDSSAISREKGEKERERGKGKKCRMWARKKIYRILVVMDAVGRQNSSHTPHDVSSNPSTLNQSLRAYSIRTLGKEHFYYVSSPRYDGNTPWRVGGIFPLVKTGSKHFHISLNFFP